MEVEVGLGNIMCLLYTSVSPLSGKLPIYFSSWPLKPEEDINLPACLLVTAEKILQSENLLKPGVKKQ